MGHGQYAKGKGNGSGVMPQVVNVQIPNVEACASYHCPSCMNNIFEMAFRIWEISALLSPIGIAQPANEQVWRCTGCGLAWPQNVLKKLLPGERQELIAAMRAKRQDAETRGRGDAEKQEAGTGEVVETLEVPEGLAG